MEKWNTLPAIRCKTCGLLFKFGLISTGSKVEDPPKWKCTPCLRKCREAYHGISSTKKLHSDADMKDVHEAEKEPKIKPKKESENETIKKTKNKPKNESEEKSLEDRVTDILNKQAIIEVKTLQYEKYGVNKADSVEERILACEQYGRVRNLEFHNLAEYATQNLTQIILRACINAGMFISEKDFEWIGRVGKVNTSKPRIVLVKFHNQYLKNDVLRALKRCNIRMQDLGYGGDPTTIRVYENLTQPFNEIRYIARTEGNFKYIWTYNCKVFVRKDDDSEKILVRSLRHLRKLINETNA